MFSEGDWLSYSSHTPPCSPLLFQLVTPAVLCPYRKSDGKECHDIFLSFSFHFPSQQRVITSSCRPVVKLRMPSEPMGDRAGAGVRPQTDDIRTPTNKTSTSQHHYLGESVWARWITRINTRDIFAYNDALQPSIPTSPSPSALNVIMLWYFEEGWEKGEWLT